MALDWTEFTARRAAPSGISQRLPSENVCPLPNFCIGRVVAVSEAACRSVRRQPHSRAWI